MVSNRRAFLLSLAGTGVCAAASGELVPSEIKRYSDPATEFPVYRLTDPGHQSWLPAYFARAISRRDSFMIYSSDRSGTVQPYRMDLKTGVSRMLARAENLVHESLTLAPGERNFYYLDGRNLFEAGLSGSHRRLVYRIADGYELGRGFSVSDDGLYGALVEQKPGNSRLLLITLRNGRTAALTESSEPISDPMPRPSRAGMLYRKADRELWLVNFDGNQNRKLHLAAGGLGPAVWAPDGRTVIYLNFPMDTKKLNNLREATPDTNQDRLIADTSQFVGFGPNGDASVLVGASGSKASPYVLLLVRAVQRELTLCEHRASDPRMVAPVFSPNSQRIFFHSDKDGKIAIYSMVVEKLVSETDAGDK